MPSASFISFGTPMRTPFRSSRSRKLDVRHVHRRRVVHVAPGDDRVEQRTVAHVLRDRPDLVERRRERDDAEPRDRAVGRAQADVAAERRGLLDRAAGVGAERPRREPARDRGRRAAARAAGDALGVPRDCATGRTRSSRSTSPSRTRRCSSCRGGAARAACSAPRRSRRRRARSSRGSSSRRSSARPSSRSRP